MDTEVRAPNTEAEVRNRGLTIIKPAVLQMECGGLPIGRTLKGTSRSPGVAIVRYVLLPRIVLDLETSSGSREEFDLHVDVHPFHFLEGTIEQEVKVRIISTDQPVAFLLPGDRWHRVSIGRQMWHHVVRSPFFAGEVYPLLNIREAQSNVHRPCRGVIERMFSGSLRYGN